jgi:predicted acylesterase/phospholipase RssA
VEAGGPATDVATDQLLALARMETALVGADLEEPGTPPPDIARLRYLLGFARLTTFQPGAAIAGRRRDRPDVSVADEVAPFRSRVVDELRGSLGQGAERSTGDRLSQGLAALHALADPLDGLRRAVLERHASDFSEAELDAEAGRRALVLAGGGGGGAGWVYVGAYRRLQEAGVAVSFLIGSSMGSVVGLFRARDTDPDWDKIVALAQGMDRRVLFTPVSVKRRYGLPGLLGLNMAASIGSWFTRDDGERMRIDDLAIPYESVVAGVRRWAFDRLPRRFRHTTGSLARRVAPLARYSDLGLAPAIATRMWQVAAFIDPRMVKPIILGSDGLTAACDAVDAAGFSAAIPGVLHYDVHPDDARMDRLLGELVEREEVAALVDGGVVSNVPAEQAWRRVQAGKLGTRNAFILAFDCFHPQWDPRHLWLQPLTQAVQVQMNRNAPFADLVLRFEPTLSPVDLVPPPERLDTAFGWGHETMARSLPLVQRMLEPVNW